MVCDNLLFGDHQGLPTASVYSDAAGELEEQTGVRADERVAAVGQMRGLLLLGSCSMKALTCWVCFAPQVLYELPTNTQWCFDIQWCPRNPAVLSAASFDGRISVYSIMGGSTDGLRQKQVDQVLKTVQLLFKQGHKEGGNETWEVFSGCLQPCLQKYHFSTNRCSLEKHHFCFFPLVLSKLSSSFGNLDPFGTGQPLPPLQLPQQTAPQSVVLPLKKPPKWIRRPMGASFSVRRRQGWAGREIVLAPAKLLRKGRAEWCSTLADLPISHHSGRCSGQLPDGALGTAKA